MPAFSARQCRRVFDEMRSRDNAARQNHLSRAETINRGAYYTAPAHVRTVRKMLRGVAKPGAMFLDSACGYGAFLRNRENYVGCDADAAAAKIARANNPRAAVFCANALANVSRKKFKIAEDAKLVIVGNPPFNDRTSQIRRRIKTADAAADGDIKTRDSGMSFLLSFAKLRADAVCVLHPLSYLIKPANFARLRGFMNQYALRKAEILDSASFPDNSQTVAFPIVVALYVRDKNGTTADNARQFRFSVGDLQFAADDFQYLDSLLCKYPRARRTDDLDGVQFYTMRDINALRRNRTFLFAPFAQGAQSVPVARAQLDYYIYADVFKHFARHVPYYFGNCGVMIDAARYQNVRRYFVADAVRRHPLLRRYVADKTIAASAGDEKIKKYFRNLLGKHYQN